MPRLFPQLTEEEEVIYNWQYGYASDFAIGLMRLLTQADVKNQGKLAKVFPVEVSGYQLYVYAEGWWQEVQDKVMESKKQKEPNDE